MTRDELTQALVEAYKVRREYKDMFRMLDNIRPIALARGLTPAEVVDAIGYAIEATDEVDQRDHEESAQ